MPTKLPEVFIILSVGQWRSQPKNWGGGKMFHFRWITLFCLEKYLSKHKMTVFQKFGVGHRSFGPLWLPL